MHTTPLQPILIVEDNDYEFREAQRAFQQARLANPIYRCIDGDEALDYLYRRGEFADPASSPRPGIILLDLGLPRTNGREVLKDVKSNPDLKTIPVIVLTKSDDERDVQDCYAAGANSYIRKPVTPKTYLEAVQRLDQYWFHIVILPESPSQS